MNKEVLARCQNFIGSDGETTYCLASSLNHESPCDFQINFPRATEKNDIVELSLQSVHMNCRPEINTLLQDINIPVKTVAKLL